VFKNRVLRKIFEPKREAEYVACIGGRIITYRISVVEPEGNRPLVRPKCRYEDNS
jgi:hypothetical protein